MRNCVMLPLILAVLFGVGCGVQAAPAAERSAVVDELLELLRNTLNDDTANEGAVQEEQRGKHLEQEERGEEVQRVYQDPVEILVEKDQETLEVEERKEDAATVPEAKERDAADDLLQLLRNALNGNNGDGDDTANEGAVQEQREENVEQDGRSQKAEQQPEPVAKKDQDAQDLLNLASLEAEERNEDAPVAADMEDPEELEAVIEKYEHELLILQLRDLLQTKEDKKSDDGGDTFHLKEYNEEQKKGSGSSHPGGK